jgi:SHS family lactate transporter-like MFS transporter
MHFESSDIAGPSIETPGWHFAVASGILGWILDAFDFFVVTYLLDDLASRYGVPKSSIILTLTLTMVMRPVGALLFGALADRFGRRRPLIVCVLYFSAITVCSGLAPTFLLFSVFRALYGIGMGGYWGIGASYAMESAPLRKRGVLSGLMQAGYPFGNLLAAVGMLTLVPHLGWHIMFYVGSVLAVVIVILVAMAPESHSAPHGSTTTVGSIFASLFANMKIFLYLLALMAAMTCLSHGTQDLYPDFLRAHSFLTHATLLGQKPTFAIPVLYNIAAVVGALCIGQLSQRIGRRYAIILALGLCIVSMHWWAFGGSLLALTWGACLMQAGVQGAFGVIPAHLNELSPAAIRGLFAGFVYQLGVLISAGAPSIEDILHVRFGYSWAIAGFEIAVIATLLLLIAFGPEKHGQDLHAA